SRGRRLLRLRRVLRPCARLAAAAAADDTDDDEDAQRDQQARSPRAHPLPPASTRGESLLHGARDGQPSCTANSLTIPSVQCGVPFFLPPLGMKHTAMYCPGSSFVMMYCVSPGLTGSVPSTKSTFLVTSFCVIFSSFVAAAVTPGLRRTSTISCISFGAAFVT